MGIIRLKAKGFRVAGGGRVGEGIPGERGPKIEDCLRSYIPKVLPTCLARRVQPRV